MVRGEERGKIVIERGGRKKGDSFIEKQRRILMEKGCGGIRDRLTDKGKWRTEGRLSAKVRRGEDVQKKKDGKKSWARLTEGEVRKMRETNREWGRMKSKQGKVCTLLTGFCRSLLVLYTV